MLDNYEWFKTEILKLTKIDLNFYKEKQMRRRIDTLVTKNGAKSNEDYVASAKILSEFAEKHENFSVKGGFLDGEVISLEKIDSLAKLPSKEVLLATVAAAFQAPMASFARAINAIVEKDGEAAPAADEAPAEEAAPAAEEAPAAE